VSTVATTPAAISQRTHRTLKKRLQAYARSLTDIGLILLWLSATFSGVILWETLGFVPEGPGKGERVMLWGLSTNGWGEIHLWVSLAAVAFTLFHIVLDWKALKGAIRYFIRARGLPA